MPVETIESPTAAPDTQTSGGEIPPIFGRCPVCKKPLRPRDRHTNAPKAPPIGQGILSRAKCDKCGTNRVRRQRRVGRMGREGAERMMSREERLTWANERAKETPIVGCVCHVSWCKACPGHEKLAAALVEAYETGERAGYTEGLERALQRMKEAAAMEEGKP